MEQIPDTFPSLFWGYAAIWAVLVLYIYRLGRKVSRLEEERLSRRQQ